MLPRKEYLDKLVRKKDNGRVKVITGLRRSGKSVLVFQLFRDYLLSEGVSKDQIIGLALDVYSNAKYRNPMELDKFVRDHMIEEGERYYILIDEIQYVSEIQNPYVDNEDAKITFIDVILGFMHMDKADVYVTSSNSRMLSSEEVNLISFSMKYGTSLVMKMPLSPINIVVSSSAMSRSIV